MVAHHLFLTSLDSRITPNWLERQATSVPGGRQLRFDNLHHSGGAASLGRHLRAAPGCAPLARAPNRRALVSARVAVPTTAGTVGAPGRRARWRKTLPGVGLLKQQRTGGADGGVAYQPGCSHQTSWAGANAPQPGPVIARRWVGGHPLRPGTGGRRDDREHGWRIFPRHSSVPGI